MTATTATSSQERDLGMPIDREANQQIVRWAGIPAEDFLARWDALPADTLERARDVFGMKAGSWTASRRQDFHKNAVRFALNTAL